MEVSRRRLLRWAGGGFGAYSAAEALESVVLGYGPVVGTNLREQAADGSLAELARERLAVRDRYVATVDDVRLAVDTTGAPILTVTPETGGDGSSNERVRHRLADLTPADAAAIDDRFALAAGPVAQLTRDLPAIAGGDVDTAFVGIETFRERATAATTRPFTVGAVRGPFYATPPPAAVERFVGADPTRPLGLIEALAEAFRQRTNYDVPRYLAGAIYYNLLFGTADIRKPLKGDVSMRGIAEDGGELFCQEYTYRSIEAMHAVAAHRQRPPVVGVEVHDRRHKHVYTGLATLLREDESAGGDLTLLMTFLDYMHVALYDDFHLRGLLGDGLAAFGTRHRATDIYWGH